MLPADANALVDILENDPEWAEWSIDQLRAIESSPAGDNPIIYRVTVPSLVLRRPRYCRQDGTKSNVPGDFFIGTHAAVSSHPVLTKDTRRYTVHFPGVTLIAPEVSA
jgi:hypothetical protein